MATHVIEKLIDDLTGGDAHETIRFTYDGIDYTIDLNSHNAARLRRILKPYTDHGTRIGRAVHRRRPGRLEETRAGRNRIRRWAWNSGNFPDLSANGRIPQTVIDAYHDAND